MENEVKYSTSRLFLSILPFFDFVLRSFLFLVVDKIPVGTKDQLARCVLDSNCKTLQNKHYLTR